MNEVRAYYFDGKTSRRLEVNLIVHDSGELFIDGQDLNLKFLLEDVRDTSAVGSQRPALYFPDGSKCEILDEVDVPSLLRRSGSLAGVIHRLENKRRYILPGLIIAVLVVWGLIDFGIPALSRYAAFSLPAETTKLLGEHTLEVLDGSVLHPTQLPKQRVAALQREFSKLMGPRDYPVYFRSSKAFGPNAFVLPSGEIIFTDALVKLADDDRELLAVLAHELGHIEERHTLRQLLQSSMTALFLSLMMGDITSASSFAATLPVFLVQMKYSREFETEADDYAVTFLRRHGISPEYMVAALNRLAQVHKEGADSPDFLASHPATAKRIAHLKAAEK